MGRPHDGGSSDGGASHGEHGSERGAAALHGGPSEEATQAGDPLPPSAEVTQAGAPLPRSAEATQASGGASGSTGATVAVGASAGRSVHGRATELPRGAVVGRYVVLGRLGAGGMGVVYAAYDPELDRKVALKVLRADAAIGSGSRSTTGGARLLREAQALAKLSHPNVVAIHDVGEHEGQVWLAMEFVEGKTLGAWLMERSRSWKDVLSVMLPVARGLAAAHAKGLVHRDAKPENVMIGADGRVRVMDFGLARADGRPAVAGSEAGPRVEALGVELTRAGSLLGTPAYMSPEQFSGGEVGPASDQFSYCVMVWEALYGERPYGGETVASLALNVLQGKRRAPPSGRKVPRWLRKVAERGLEVEPSRRFSDMGALIEALERGQARSRLRQAAAALVLVGVAAAGAYGWGAAEHRARVSACKAEGAQIGEVWNDGARSRLREALAGSGVPYGAETAEKVMPWLDDFAARWKGVRTKACTAARVEEAWPEELYERAAWCLDEERMRLSSLVEVLGHGDAKAVEKAVLAAAGLPRPEACISRVRLEQLPVPPEKSREEVRKILVERGRVRSLLETGAYDEGLEVARALSDHAERFGWAPLEAEARYLLGSFAERKGDYEEAEAMLEEAYFEAAKAGTEEVAFDAAAGLTFVVGKHQARHADGVRWSRIAEVHEGRLSDVAGLREARRLNNLANVYKSQGNYQDARRLFERSLAIRERALSPAHPLVAMSLNNLAALYYAQGDYDTARRLFERSLTTREKSLGPEHPHVAQSLNNLAAVYRSQGEYEAARRLYERSLAISEKSLGPEHPDVASGLNNLANVYYTQADYEAASRLYTRSLAIREKSLGPEHPHVASSLNHLAMVHSVRGDYATAYQLYRRSLAICEKTLGPKHPRVGEVLNNLANAYKSQGAYDEAQRSFERALAIWEKSLGPEHPHMSYPLVGLAEVALAKRRPQDAVRHAERAVALREGGKTSPEDLAEARFVLARALWAADRDQARALELAAKARDAYREAGKAREKELGEVEAWLAEREPSK
ncbi:MAG: serine/threonine protein kinase [Deltaproteobacteria bacterium]|nr:MAG: serine/threonine protein kinase [Deltaproteobacteria bacterium]